jgi:hypothetical protein
MATKERDWSQQQGTANGGKTLNPADIRRKQASIVVPGPSFRNEKPPCDREIAGVAAPRPSVWDEGITAGS